MTLYWYHLILYNFFFFKNVLSQKITNKFISKIIKRFLKVVGYILFDFKIFFFLKFGLNRVVNYMLFNYW